MSTAEIERPVDRLPRLDGRDRRLRTLAPLVVDDGCDVRIRGGHYADGVRVALLEWLPLTRDELALIEVGLQFDPAGALASLVRPPTIWATRDAVVAARRLDGEGTTRRERHGALAEYAFTHLGEEHLDRLRRIAARFVQELRLEGLPDLRVPLAVGCELVASDDEACAAVAATVLARYAASAFVTRRRSEAAPTMT